MLLRRSSCPFRAEEDAQFTFGDSLKDALEDSFKDRIAPIEAQCKDILNKLENFRLCCASGGLIAMPTTHDVEAPCKEIINKLGNLANAGAERVKTEESKEATPLDSELLLNNHAQLHPSCDFVLSCPIRAWVDARFALEDSSKDRIAPIEAQFKDIFNKLENFRLSYASGGLNAVPMTHDVTSRV